MMKRELAALGVLIVLAAASIWNIRQIDSLTGEIGIAVCKARTATEQLNFKSSREFIEVGMDIWEENQKYARVFLSQTQVDDTTQAFYQLMEALSREDILALPSAYDSLLYRLETMRSGESPSVSSVF